MPVQFSPDQFAACDAIAVEDFHRELYADMVAAFPDMDQQRIFQYCALCRTTCARLGVETSHAIYCFYILSLHLDRLLSETDGYVDQHVRYVKKYGSGNQLPIDLHARLS